MILIEIVIVLKVSYLISYKRLFNRLFFPEDFQNLAIVNISLNKNSKVRAKIIQYKKPEIQSKHVLKITEEN